MRGGTKFRKVRLYRRSETVRADELVQAVAGAVTPRTGVVALTWVHSDSGLKLPIRAIADELARRPGRPLLCVDGVHGFGVEDADMRALGCDFFVAGCHKWLYGPRGTGVVYAARAELWQRVRPTIPPFGLKDTPGLLRTPGGFHPFEHRWALAEAFRFHLQIGKAAVAARIRELATQLEEGLSAMPRVVLRTPKDPELSAGIVAFDIEGMHPDAVIRRMKERDIVLTRAPHGTRSVRAAPGIVNTPEEIERTLAELRRLV